MAGTLTEGDVLEIMRQQTERFEQLEAENQALRTEIVRLKRKSRNWSAKGAVPQSL